MLWATVPPIAQQTPATRKGCLMSETCAACNHPAVERSLCADCLALYFTGVEERSSVIGAIMARRHPLKIGDPWA